MDEILNFLTQLKDNPDDLSALPQAIEKATAIKKELEDAYDKIGRLQELNKKYLSMIPIKDETEPEPKEEPDINLDDVINSIIKGEWFYEFNRNYIKLH